MNEGMETTKHVSSDFEFDFKSPILIHIDTRLLLLIKEINSDSY
jgi:hypothetical protein